MSMELDEVLRHRTIDGEADNDLLASTPFLTKRDVYDHDKFDLKLLKKVEGINTLKPWYRYHLENLVATWILFNAITTIMIILTNFEKSTPAKTREEFGEEKFDNLMNVIIYVPLFFFVFLLLLVNNYFSEKTFYLYLKHGAIVDFPMSSNPKFLFTHWQPLAFILPVVSYMCVAIYTLIKFSASVGTIAIFFNNVLIGIGLFWYKQQGIESKFISISDFIQAFKDRSGQYYNMDEMSLHRAAKMMEKFTLTESKDPSYTSYMRTFYWKEKNYTSMQRIVHHGMVVVLIGGLLGLALGYFLVLGRLDVQNRYTNEINPCISSCVRGGIELANVSVTQTTATFCQYCVCTCLATLRMKDSGTIGSCDDYFSNSFIGDTRMCPEPTSHNCPQSCDWYPGWKTH